MPPIEYKLGVWSHLVFKPGMSDETRKVFCDYCLIQFTTLRTIHLNVENGEVNCPNCFRRGYGR